MVLRPDEEASLEAIERDKKNRNQLKSGVNTAATLAGVGVASRLAPFFSDFIPVDLAIKGISKISPKVGEFLKRGQSMGLDMKEGLDFVKNKVNPAEASSKKRNIIEQYSPELHQFLDQEIRGGKKPIEAGASALMDKVSQKGFRKIIQQITKDHNISWSDLLESIYGVGEKGLDEGEANRRDALKKFNEKKKSGLIDQEQERFNKVYGEKSAGPGQQALMAILDKINQKLGQ